MRYSDPLLLRYSAGTPSEAPEVPTYLEWIRKSKVEQIPSRQGSK